MDTATQPINQHAGVCLFDDGNTRRLVPDLFIDNKFYFDMQKVKKVLRIDLFEIVHVSDTDYIIICDEEALCKADPIQNVMASAFANYPIYGNAMICHTDCVR